MIPVGVLGIIVYSEMCGRVAAVSGKAVFDAIRERVGFNAALGALVSSVPWEAVVRIDAKRIIIRDDAAGTN